MNPLELMLRLVFATVGGGLVLVALVLSGMNAYVLLTYERAPGVVVSSQRIGPPAGKSSTYSLRVRYRGSRGTVVAEADRTMTQFEEGEAVTVYHHPDDPFEIKVHAFWTMWFAPTIVGVCGTIMLVQGLRPYRRDQAPGTSQP